ncbi:MAG: hypothetical protein F4X63_04055 [Nitrospira sp. SB0662_bin_26]|nr:hypothetical protein [Nitrospira sp. SB0662_bin_26]
MMRLAAMCLAMALSACVGNPTFDDAHLLLNSVLDGACNQPSFKRPLQPHEYGTYSKEMMILRGTCQSIAPLLPHNY